VFVDDDITVEPGFVAAMCAPHGPGTQLIAIGDLVPDSARGPAWPAALTAPDPDRVPAGCVPLPFTACLAGFMSVRRSAFIELGLMQPVASSGSSVWCDVEFAYRAHLAGYSFVRTVRARGLHHDESRRDFASERRRMFRVGRESVALLHRHPALISYLPMLEDKTPVARGRDTWRLAARKTLRRAGSSPPAVALLEAARPASERMGAGEAVRRWILGAEVRRGLVAGLAAYGSLELEPEPS
jgi:GT2 family glycosyltransferase